MKKRQKQMCNQILDGSLKQFELHIAGNYKGFYMTVEPEKKQWTVTVAANLPGEDKNDCLEKFLRKQQTAKKEMIGFLVEPYFVKLSIYTSSYTKNAAEIVNGVIEPLIAYLSVNRYVSGCHQCGKAISMQDQYQINESYCYMCNDCASEMFRRVRQKKSNPILGLAGAVLGSLIGGILWFIFSRWGMIAGIAGAVTGLCAFEGYEKAGGCLDRKGRGISALVTIFAIYLFNRTAWFWEAYDALKFSGFTFAEVFGGLEGILTEAGVKWEYYGTLFVGYMLTLVCAARPSFRAFFAAAPGDRFRHIG